MASQDDHDGTEPNGETPEAPYTVGYRRPPRHTQWKKGQSGHRAGRKKGSKNYATAFENEHRAIIEVTEGGHKHRITKREAIAKRLVSKAIGGDIKASAIVIAQDRLHQEGVASGPSLDVLARPQDALVMAGIVERIRRSAPFEETPPEGAGGEGAAS